jgi:LytS/YehU family sensor histidine kinase
MIDKGEGSSIRKLEIDNLKFELNPHTFKNILQQIQSLSLSTNRAIENLMQILNYMLYDTDKEQVPLQQEIDFVIAYKKMQQAIVPGFVDIVFENKIEDEFIVNKGIAPMLSVGFLENAFKHADTSSKNCYIKITMKNEGQHTFIYTVENNWSEGNLVKPKSGIGYKNLRRRLDLLYPNQYEINSGIVGNVFKADLKINLNNHEN